MFKRIGIIAKENDPRVLATLQTLVWFLKSRGVAVALDVRSAEILGTSDNFEQIQRVNGGCDLVVTVGGDGTLLSAVHVLPDPELPIVGINLGRLGFLADVSPDELPGAIGQILDGHYEEESRFALECEIHRGEKVIPVDLAINDIVLQKWNIARLIAFDTRIDGVFVHSQRSDGMIVSTPTGSTAYALAGGGPIVHPNLNALVLVPICPHTLTNRPIVVNADSEVELVMGTREHDQARLTCDGELREEVLAGDRILIRKSKRRIRLIHPSGHDYYATLRAKLRWATDPC
jgi:NAD+ kinase